MEGWQDLPVQNGCHVATEAIVHMQRLVLCFFFLLLCFQLEVLNYDCLCHLLRHLMADILLYTQSTPSDLKLSLTCKASDKHWLDKFVYCWNSTASIVVGLTIPVGVCRKPCSISSLLSWVETLGFLPNDIPQTNTAKKKYHWKLSLPDMYVKTENNFQKMIF